MPGLASVSPTANRRTGSQFPHYRGFGDVIAKEVTGGSGLAGAVFVPLSPFWLRLQLGLSVFTRGRPKLRPAAQLPDLHAIPGAQRERRQAGSGKSARADLGRPGNPEPPRITFQTGAG